MSMDTVIQIGLAVFGAIMVGLMTAISFILKVIWAGLREAQKSDIDQYKEIAKLQLHVSTEYVRQAVLKEELSPIKTKLDQIFEALWKAPPIDRRTHEGDK